MLTALRNAYNAFRSTIKGPPRPGEVIEFSRDTDEVADLIIGDITPQRAKSVLQTAAHGDPAEQYELFDTMLESDGHLESVWGTRLRGLTGLDWELVPANEVGKSPRIDEQLAQDAQAYCAEVIGEIEGWEEGLCHLAEAIGRCTSVLEPIWDRTPDGPRPVAIKTIPFTALRLDPSDRRRLRISTSDNYQGVAIDEFAPGQFIVHTPVSRGGNRFRGGLLRGAVLGFMVKRFGRKWWFTCLELFGMPFTIGKYPTDGTGDATVKNQMLTMIRDMGVSRGGVFPVGSEIELVELQHRGQWPHERMVKYVDAEYSKEFLGQTLTTEIGETGGSNAAAQTHDEVREDLRDDDIRREGATIRSQLLVPLVVYKFGEEARGAAPFFRRVVEEARDLKVMGDLAALAVNQLGASVPARFVPDELGIPITDDVDLDSALPGQRSGFGPFTAPQSNGRCHHDLDVQANRALGEIVGNRRTAVGKLAAWVFAAVLASHAHTRTVIGEVTAMVERVGELQVAQRELPALFDQLPTDEMFELERQFLLAANLAGRIHTRQQMLANKRIVAASARNVRRLALAEIFFDRLPFERAIAAFRERLDLDPEEFEALEAEARSRAWRIAGVWDMRLLAMAHGALAESMTAGETSRDFRLRLPELAEQKGWFGENPWHADLVHFQNMAMSHAAGRFSEYGEFGVHYWRFVANGESCPICEPQIGKVFAMGDRDRFPPLHFWCNCEDEPVFDEEFSPNELAHSGSLPNTALSASRVGPSGFNWDVMQYANLEPVDLAAFPPEFRGRFLEFGRPLGWEFVG